MCSAVRMHVNTGTGDTSWKVPLSAWLWRFNEKKCGGGPLVFDHGYHLFSLGYYLGGPVEKVFAWIDQTPVKEAGGIVKIDAPAMIMFQYKAQPPLWSVGYRTYPQDAHLLDYYADDDRIEVIGEKGHPVYQPLHCQDSRPARADAFQGWQDTLPSRWKAWNGTIVSLPLRRISSNKLKTGGQPRLDGPTGKAVLQFTLAALQSASTGKEVRPDDVK